MKFKITHKQNDFIFADEQFSAYVGGVGVGKSTALIIKALHLCQIFPGNLGVLVRKNFTDLRDSTMKDFEMYSGFKVAEQKKECVLPNGSTILFRHADEISVLKNLNLGFFGIEQAEEMPDSEAWEFLKMRLRRRGSVEFRPGFMIANTNGHNWIWEMFKKNGPPANHRLVECTTYEHVEDARSLGVDTLTDDYIKTLETLPKKKYRRYVLNSWEEAEGLVYDEFLESRDVVEPFAIPDSWEKGFCLDHGFRNPTAVLWYAIDFDGNIYFYAEHYEKEKPISYHAQAIKDMSPLRDGIADPSILAKNQQSGGRVYSIADEYADFGITLRGATRSAEEASIARVNEFFKAGRIRIFKNLQNTITEVGNWKWKEVRPGVNAKEEPQDLNNHACDVIKYVIASRFSNSQKPAERAQTHSLDYYDHHVQMVARERDKDKPLW